MCKYATTSAAAITYVTTENENVAVTLAKRVALSKHIVKLYLDLAQPEPYSGPGLLHLASPGFLLTKRIVLQVSEGQIVTKVTIGRCCWLTEESWV